jgi:hypothetical protein
VAYDAASDPIGAFRLGKRQFTPKETYTPKNLNPMNLDRHLHNQGLQKKQDFFSVHSMDPLKEYKNTRLLSEFGIY